MADETSQINVDGFYNLLTSLGVEGSDKRLNAVAAEPTVISQQELNRLYRGDDIVARICNLPANEMTQTWFQIKATEDGDREKIDAMMAKLRDLGAKHAINEALVWSRLHGGSVIILGVDDGRPPEEPLNEDGIRSIDYLTVMDRWDLEVISTYSEPDKPNYRMPETYRIRQTTQPGVNTAPLGVDPIVHESRILRFDGVLTPAIIKLSNQGWCDSVITRVYEVVRDYQTSYGGVGLLMQDIGQAIIKIKGLANALAHDKEGIILTRLQLMNVSRSVARAVPLDLDGEDIVYPDQKIQGIATILEKFDIRLSMAIGWPATILLGQSPKGLNATGESDLTNWYDYIDGERERNMDRQLSKLVGIVFKALGDEPETWAVSFNPLWQATAKEVAEERKIYAEVDASNIDRGVYTAEEVAQSRYSGEEFSTEVNLDDELRDTDKIPSADPLDVPDLREPEGDDPKTEKPQDEAMAAGQITALMDVVKAFNNEEISREQAISILVVTFQMDKAEAASLVGLEPAGKEPEPVPPGLVPFNTPPVPRPPLPEPNPEPDPEPEPEPTTDSIEKHDNKWVVLSKAGALLGSHTTKHAAETQLQAIEAAKHKRE